MLASRGWSDGNVEFSARNAVYREQAKCEAFSKYNCVFKISIQVRKLIMTRKNPQGF